MTAYRACYEHSVYVTLTRDEINAAARMGLAERALSVRHAYQDRSGYRPDDAKALRVQALSKVAEASALKALGLPLSLLRTGTLQGADIEPDIEVRLIGADHYGLRVYPGDGDWKRVLGVVIPKGHERKQHRVAGWILAADAKREEWKIAPGGRPPMYAVPQSALRPISELCARAHA